MAVLPTTHLTHKHLFDINNLDQHGSSSSVKPRTQVHGAGFSLSLINTSMEIALTFNPYPWQELCLGTMKKYNCWIVPRGHGKTYLVRYKLVDACLTVPGKYLYVCPELKQARRNLWDDLKLFLKPLTEPITVNGRKQTPVLINEQYSTVEFPNGSKLYILGADEPDNLRGIHPTGMVIDETQDVKPEALEVLEGAHANLKWQIFIGTPKGHNVLWETFNYAKENPEEWSSFHTDATKLKQMSPKELERRKQKAINEKGSDAFFRQEFLCDFDAAVSGAYYSYHMGKVVDEGRITDVPYNPKLPVHTAWDLGTADATAIWFFQTADNKVSIIDYMEVQNNNGLPEVIRYVHQKPYVYGSHIAPHDSQQRQANGLTKADIARQLGINFDIIAPKTSIDDGIEQVRLTLPICYFDKTKCAEGLENLKQYSPRVSKEGVIIGPKHDKYSHGADAFRYLATCVEDVRNYSASSFDWRTMNNESNWYNPLEI